MGRGRGIGIKRKETREGGSEKTGGAERTWEMDGWREGMALAPGLTVVG